VASGPDRTAVAYIDDPRAQAIAAADLVAKR